MSSPRKFAEEFSRYSKEAKRPSLMRTHSPPCAEASAANKRFVSRRVGSNKRLHFHKHTWAIMLLSFLLLLISPVACHAQFSYTTNNGVITIMGYEGPGGDVVIPSTIEEMPVVAIWSNAFADRSSVTSVSIPASVSSIGTGAFTRCKNLNVITVDPLNPFFSSADGVLLDKNQTVLLQCPGGKTGSYIMPDTVMRMEFGSFDLCSRLSSVVISAGVAYIPSAAFRSCSNLTSIAIPPSVVTVETYAFAYCTSLTNVVIPSSVSYLGQNMFQGCTSLLSITLPASVNSVPPGMLTSCVNLTNLLIPASVTSIGTNAFDGCSKLTDIAIPNVVSQVGDRAFQGCSSLVSLTLPAGVTNLKSLVFSGCTNLIAVHFQGNAPSVASGQLLNANQMTAFYLPGTTGWGTTLGGRPTASWNPAVPYTYRTNDGSITITDYWGEEGEANIPSTIEGLPVTAIASYAFSSSSNLTSVAVPDTVSRIGAGTFRDCPNLSAITVHALNPVFSSGEGVLFDKTQTILLQYPAAKPDSYTVPDTVVTIGDGAFSSCSKLTAVALGNSVLHIGSQAFASSTSLTAITFSSNLCDIAHAAFRSCTNLDGIVVPDSVTNIGEFAFQFCTGLTAISLPDSITNIWPWTFERCIGLASVSLGDHVARIGYGCFGYCTNLSNITLGSSLRSIDGSAFTGCTSLADLVFPPTLTSLGQSAFHGCSALVSLTFPDSLREVARFAFNACTGLTSVALGEGVTSIGDSAFYRCASLTNITWGSHVTGIEDNAFGRCAALPSVTIPDTVTYIDSFAFNRCPSLSRVTVGSGVGVIASFAFADCTKLAGVFFRGNAPTGNSSVFSNSGQVIVYYLPGTTGWGATFGGRPTALWLPQAQASDASFGVRTNQFGFNIAWASGQTVVVEACTDLASPLWSPLQTNTLNGDLFYFADPDWMNHPSRFYRIRSP